MYVDVKQLHVELTDKCNARCPMCVRTTFDGKEQPWLLKRELYLEDFMDIVRVEDVKKLDKVNFCGNYGEPLAARDLIPIIEYLYQHNPTLYIEVASNGHPRNEDWWWDLLAATVGKDFRVVFGIDGINQESHEMYRRNTKFDRIMENARFFIDNGGVADWQYLIFKHNEDDVETARQMANEYGFANFLPIVTERFWSGDYQEYESKGTRYQLQRATRGNSLQDNGRKVNSKVEIKCFAKQLQEAYIDCLGLVTPCCYLGMYAYAAAANLPRDFHNADELMNMFYEIDLNRLQGRGKGLSEVVKDQWFFDLLLMHQKSNPDRCHKVCGIQVENKEYVV